MKRILSILVAAAVCIPVAAQIKINVHEDTDGQPVIPAELFGQFSEHLGHCI